MDNLFYSSPPEGNSDDAVQAYKRQSFEPGRLAIIDDSRAEQSCETQGGYEEWRQHKGKMGSTKNEAKQNQNRCKSQGHLQGAVENDTDGVVGFVAGGELNAHDILHRVAGQRYDHQASKGG